MGLWTKIIKTYKEQGIGGVAIKALNRGKGIARPSVFDTYSFVIDDEAFPFVAADFEEHKDDAVKILNWVIPEPGIGSGGHMNIFRFCSMLEGNGFHNHIYILESLNFRDNQSLKTFVLEYFPVVDHDIEWHYDVKSMTFAHATIATAWHTAYKVRNFHNTISKFYFVQDYEPYFFPRGSVYEFARSTYDFGFRGITAGDWLKEKLANENGMKTDSFGFSYDKTLYSARLKKDDRKRIFFYTRPYTARRDFEIGVLAIHELMKKHPDTEIVFAGEDVSKYKIEFPYTNLGIAKPETLSEVYAQCDLCLVLSNTNLSLLPLEIMASNSVVVGSVGENNTWLLNEDVSIFVNYDPRAIADTLSYYLTHLEALEPYRIKGLSFALSTTWEQEGEKVKTALLKGIAEDGEK